MNLLINCKERFEKSFTKHPSGCWLWNGCTKGSGYGYFKVNGKNVRAHRVSYVIYKGEIINGLWVLHKCDIKSCVNPDHLYLGDAKDNMQDILARLQPNWGRKFSTSSKCSHGHLWDEKTTRYDNKGYRYCLQCSKDRSSAAYYKRKINRNLVG